MPIKANLNHLFGSTCRNGRNSLPKCEITRLVAVTVSLFAPFNDLIFIFKLVEIDWDVENLLSDRLQTIVDFYLAGSLPRSMLPGVLFQWQLVVLWWCPRAMGKFLYNILWVYDCRSVSFGQNHAADFQSTESITDGWETTLDILSQMSCARFRVDPRFSITMVPLKFSNVYPTFANITVQTLPLLL